MNQPIDPRDPSNRDSATGDPFDDLLSRALVSRASAARPGSGSLTDVHKRVRRHARRRTAVGAGAIAGLGLVGVGAVLLQDDDAPAPIQTADGNTDDGTVSTTTSTGPADATTLAPLPATTLAPSGGQWRCEGEVAPPVDPAQPDVTLPGRWFESCEYVDLGTVTTTTITLPGDPTTSIGSVASEQPLIGIRVLVANGSDVGGLAGDMSSALEALGASVAAPQTAAYRAEETRVYLIGNTGRDLRALLELTGAAEVEPIDASDAEGLIEGEIGTAQVLVVVGRDQVVAESPDTTGAPMCAHIVLTGDYLAGIAERYGVSIDEIVAANEWPDGSNHILIPGAEVLIPRSEC